MFNLRKKQLILNINIILDLCSYESCSLQFIKTIERAKLAFANLC